MRRRISSPALVGRRHELEVVDDLLAQARAGRPSLCVLVGEAGVGKTRLAREVERRATTDGMAFARGHCVALAGGEFPFAPLVGIFRQLAARPDSEAISGLAPGARRLLDVLLDTHAAELAEPIAQAKAHATMAEALRRAAAEQPIAVVVEDIHWADASTRDFLQYLARVLESERLAVVATFRSDELAGDHPVRAFVAELVRCDPVESVEVRRLTIEETREQLAAIAGAPVGGAEVEAIHARAQGNPFLAEELWATHALEAPAGITLTLADTLLARIRRLPAEAQDVLRLLAVVGRPAGHELVAAAAGDGAPTLAALRRAVDEHILVASPGGRQLTFRHALVREALYAELLPGEREALHRTVLAALAGGNPAELAYHHLAAGEPAAALTASVAAGLEDVRRMAYPEALLHFERALELWREVQPGPGGADLDRLDVYREAADAARLIGEYERAIELCRTALQEVDPAADPARAAGFFERLGRFQSWDVERALEAVEQGLVLLGPEPSAERARLMTAEALELGLHGRWREACACAERACEVAVAAEAPLEECAARAELGLALAFVGDPDAGERCLHRARELAEAAAAPEELARVYMYLGELERLRGRTAAALHAMQEGRRRVTALGASASWGALLAVLSADDLLQLGRWTELDELLEATRDARAGRPGAVMWPLVAGQLAMARGDLESACALLERSRAAALRGVTPELLPHVGAALAELRLWLDDPSSARAGVDETRRLIDAFDDDVLNTPLIYGAGVRVEVELAARADRHGNGAAAADARARTAELTAKLVALLDAAPAAARPPRALACLLEARAEVASLDEPERAAALWGDATEAWDALELPQRAAFARFRHADALLAARGDHRVATRLLRLAHAQAAGLGAALLARAAEALARRARVSLAVEAPPERPPADALGLTPREAEVLALIADGLTNRQIGERLFITPKTAGLHVSHILAKLNVDSRVKAAAVAHRAELAHAPARPDALR